ncbi:hypothetical protein SAY87_001413 [Trapa incisa]|uniref:Autophagy-related protein n=1 Tax=Trapa incisa TaxID=236973 RepID=A0AAN7GV85_9MYRT|nr:hypothetical protein SAY87_001413 [Trapa incisa]
MVHITYTHRAQTDGGDGKSPISGGGQSKEYIPINSAMMSAIYEENKDDDGFLYMTYSGENTFGLSAARVV